VSSAGVNPQVVTSGGSHMAEHPLEVEAAEFVVLRAGVRLMALQAFGNAEIADEVAQETIVRAFHSLRSSRPEKLGPFVAGIARHVIADIIRARPREVPLDDLAPHAEPQTQCDPLATLCEDHEKARVHEALALLTPADRELLRLVFFEQLSPSQVAERLGVPAERIRQRKLRALARLRLVFNQSGESRHAGQPGATVRHGTAPASKP
jgi:RNA polymerase sigma factor (sigma-70 family)